MKFLILLVLAFSATPLFAQEQAPRFTPPPGAESAAVKVLIDRAATVLTKKGSGPSDVLTDEAFAEVHDYPRFRELIKKHAVAGPTTIVTSKEAGEPLIVTGTVRDRQGKAAANAIIYVYQTSSRGWYSDKAYHISGMEGDHRYARLFAYLRTDSKGRFEFKTVKPSGYPGSELPAHIHFFADIPAAGESQHIGAEIQFEDDTRLTPTMRERSRREGAVIAKPAKGKDGISRVEVELSARN